MSHFLPKSEAVEALRAAADLIEKMPERYWYVEAEAFNLTADQLADAARLPGCWEKGVAGVDDSMFMLSQGIVELHADRGTVCVARETGNTVKVRKVVKPAEYAEVEVPEVVWDCEPLLARKSEEQVA